MTNTSNFLQHESEVIFFYLSVAVIVVAFITWNEEEGGNIYIAQSFWPKCHMYLTSAMIFFFNYQTVSFICFFWLSMHFHTFEERFSSKDHSNRISVLLDQILDRFLDHRMFSGQKVTANMISFKVRTYCISMHTHTDHHTQRTRVWSRCYVCVRIQKHVYKSKYLCTFWSYDTKKTERKRERETKNEWMRVMVSVAAYHQTLLWMLCVRFSVSFCVAVETTFCFVFRWFHLFSFSKHKRKKNPVHRPHICLFVLFFMSFDFFWWFV